MRHSASKDFLLFLSLVILVGICAGLGAVFFRDLIAFFHNLLFYGEFSLDYDVLKHAAPSRWGAGIIFVPVVGAIIVTFLVTHYAPEAKGHGVPEVIDAIHYKKGVIRPIVALIKSIASSISIGSGGSVGREGPIVQIGSAVGSMLGQWSRVPEWQKIVLVACGASGGIAATFNTPVAGVLFAIEIMLTELSPRMVMPICIATAVGTYMSYIFLGQSAFLTLPFNFNVIITPFDVVSYLLLSILIGCFALLFIRSIYWFDDLFDALPVNEYWRHMLGMLIMGIIMYLMITYTGHYYIQGVGYATVADILTDILNHPEFLLLLACLKLLCTCLTLGSGGSGGIFSPMLFMGAALGGAYAATCQLIFPNWLHLSIPFGALAGIAGLVGAATGAPLTAIIMTAELTNQYTLLLPLLIVVAVSSGVRRILIKETVYTYKLMLRGHIISEKLVTPKTHKKSG